MAEFYVSIDIETDADLPAVVRLASEAAQLAGLDHKVTHVTVGTYEQDGDGEVQAVPVELDEASV